MDNKILITATLLATRHYTCQTQIFHRYHVPGNNVKESTFVLIDVVHVVNVEVGVGVDGDTNIPDVGVDLSGLMSAKIFLMQIKIFFPGYNAGNKGNK